MHWHNGKPTLMVRIGNGHAAVRMGGAAKLNIDTTAEGKSFRRAQGAAARTGALLW
jgi:hypothetical protein